MTGGAVAGRPVGGGTLTAVDGAGALAARTVSGDDGHFPLDGLRTGGYTLVAAASGWQPWAGTVTVADDGITPLGVPELTPDGVTHCRRRVPG